MGGHRPQRVVDVGTVANLDMVKKVCWLGLGEQLRQACEERFANLETRNWLVSSEGWSKVFG